MRARQASIIVTFSARPRPSSGWPAGARGVAAPSGPHGSAGLEQEAAIVLARAASGSRAGSRGSISRPIGHKRAWEPAAAGGRGRARPAQRADCLRAKYLRWRRRGMLVLDQVLKRPLGRPQVSVMLA